MSKAIKRIVKKRTKRILKGKTESSSKFDKIDITQLKFLVEKGFTDFEICQFFKIHRDTFYRAMRARPEIYDAIKNWKEFANARVERALYERACGYSHESEEIFCAFGKVTKVPTVKHYAPDTVAAIIFLKNRDPQQWREKQPDPEDESLKDQELTFHGVPNLRDAKTTNKLSKFYDQN